MRLGLCMVNLRAIQEVGDGQWAPRFNHLSFIVLVSSKLT